MIFDDLVTTTKAMQDLQKKTAIKNNKAMQDNADTKYRLLLTQANHFVDVMVYLYTDLSVPKNHEILMSISELMNVLEQMHNGLNEADYLIMELGLDDEIIAFLQNTNSGRATLQDLNDKVLAWIRDEQLERKIRISFVKAK